MKKKFTLIELLVVIAIIGILVSILLPSLQKALESARFAVCTSNREQIYIAIFQAGLDNDDVLPYFYEGEVNPNPADPAFTDDWAGTKQEDGTITNPVAGDYADNAESFRAVMKCPTQPTGHLRSRNGGNGVFDYSFPQAFSGLSTEELGSEVTWLVHDGARNLPTPLIIEEHEGFINGDDLETGFGVWDRLEDYHFDRTKGGYLSMEGAMVTYRTLGKQYRTGNGESVVEFRGNFQNWEHPNNMDGGRRKGGSFNGKEFIPN